MDNLILLFGGIVIGFAFCYWCFRVKINGSNKEAEYVIPALLNEDELRHKLDDSISKEDYEMAAEYRDELHRRAELKMSAK